MRRSLSTITVICILILMTGCWDQDLLKNARLLYGAGFDVAPNGKLLSTLVIREMPASEQQSPKNDIIYSIGNTTMEARDKADDKISRFLRAYRNRIILIGEEQAKQDIYPILDTIYRDPKSALNARIGVTKGRATDLLSLEKVGNVLIAEEIDELIKSKEMTTNVPKVTVETIYPVIMDSGEDFVLPYLLEKGKRVDAGQIAMFHNRQFTGVLNTAESTMFLLLKGDRGKVVRFTQKISNSHHDGYDFITFNVNKTKRKMKIRIQSGDQITVMLDLKWKVSIVEYPKNHIADKETVVQLNQILSEEMNRLINETINKMQIAHCDGLGIGRKLRAFYPEIWKKQKEDWGSNYQKVLFVPKIQVEITKKGIIN
ncbi:hypothetical protein A8709_14565 [Paenibacillus pectinilyticus]|uniref:Uncharacterized protein n=1 Tax=Paenibacillus pectinilyticus TaxID=512399 RepID=A0A1C1A428_9BACL|nr:Ger(x)C family spore germination protein [Paenibacillus pectinilyticus]OCT15314.1 hypothetical protein A8709_14565 [Paenibacillus pectinilyticus]